MAFFALQSDLQRRFQLRNRSGIVGGGIPSWVLTAGGVAASLDIDFVNDQAYNSGPTSIASLLSCTRASSGYYTNADGTLTQFSDHQLRYGTNGSLVEEARTNVLLYSQDTSDANWTRATITVPALNAAAPDGTLTGNQWNEGTANSTHLIAQNITCATSTPSAISIYAKKGTGSYIYISRNSGGNNATAVYDLNNGVVSQTNTAANATINVASITALANGWYRCVLSTTLTTVFGGSVRFGMANAATGNTFNINGDVNAYTGTSLTVYVWGAQAEVGSTFATSYIPTTGSSATRNADLVTFASTSFFNGATDTVYASWIARNVNNAKVWALDAANDVLLDEQTGMSARISDAGGSFAITAGNTAAAAATVKAAAAIASNDAAICMNGGTVGTDATVTVAGALSASRLGCDLSGSNYLNGYITRVAYWPSRISNANLQTLMA